MGRVSSSSGEDGRSEVPDVALIFWTRDSVDVLGMADGSTTPDMVGGDCSSIRDHYRRSRIRGYVMGKPPCHVRYQQAGGEYRHSR